MSEVIYGQPSIISQAPTPQAAVSIVSSTNATPTVITATAHGLHTGQAAIISGHLLNTNANGIWIVTVLSSSTFKISTFAGFATPTYIAGNGVGAGTGTVQSLALPGITVPEDAVDDRTAASVNVPFEALADFTAWLAYRELANATILKGGTRRLLTGSVGVVDAGASETVNGDLIIDTDGVFAPTLQVRSGTMSMRDPQRKGDAAVAALTASSGQAVIFEQAPTTARVITLVAPTRDGLFIDFYMQDSPASSPATKYYEIMRSGSGNYIARLSGWTTDLATDLGTGQVRVHSEGGVWRLSGGIGYLPGVDA